MYEIKNKISVTDSYCHKVQRLTLAQESQTHKKVSNHFEVSEYLARTSIKVKYWQGILSLPGKKLKNLISKNFIKVISFRK